MLGLRLTGITQVLFFDPNLQANFIRAQAASKQLLVHLRHLLTVKQIILVETFNKKSTQRHMYQVLNLSKKIRRQLHRQK